MNPGSQRVSSGRKRRIPGRYVDHVVDLQASQSSEPCTFPESSSNEHVAGVSTSRSTYEQYRSPIDYSQYAYQPTDQFSPLFLQLQPKLSDFGQYQFPMFSFPSNNNTQPHQCNESVKSNIQKLSNKSSSISCESPILRMVSDPVVLVSPKRDQQPTKKKKVEFATEAQVKAAEVVDEATVKHLCHFLLLQLRAQCSLILDQKSEFDKELMSLDPSIDDVLCCDELMRKFFAGPALGDKWVPWNTACGDHERYIASRIYKLPNLDEKQKYLLHFAFRASSHPPFFDAVIMPLFENLNSSPLPLSSSSSSSSSSSNASYSSSSGEESPSGMTMLQSPRKVLFKGSKLHQQYTEYRDAAGANRKLHTICYRNHPPKGCGGEEYPGYMVERTAEFIEIGHIAYQTLLEIREGTAAKDKLCKVLCECNGIGPTMSKMFLVTTQLLYPELGLLDETCQVGDGASPALSLLFGLEGLSLKPVHRETLLIRLLRYLEATISELEPRFLPMLRFTVENTRKFLSSTVPKDSIPDHLTPFELQVNLCEWRKFLTVDKARTICRGCQVEALTNVAEVSKNKLSHLGGTSEIPSSSRRALSFPS